MGQGTNIVIIGAQWGDEGKGKIVDHVAEDADAVIRYNGGANAGHTLEIDGQKTILHLLPVGIVRKGMKNFVGPYVVCDPKVVIEELAIASRCGSTVTLDHDARLILPIHKKKDAAREHSSGTSAIGTTGRGIGPCYEDFASRNGVVLGDLAKGEDAIRHALERGNYYEERRAALRAHGADCLTLDETIDCVMKYADALTPHLGDVRAELSGLQRAGKCLVFEGAQGMMLDLVHGGRPYCTSSFCGAGAISATLGIHRYDPVIGVSKAYATRVGGGAFPTKLTDETGKRLQTEGNEFGATTGRPRDCGWLDLVALAYACRMGGVTELVLTKLDILAGMETVKLCVGYSIDGMPLSHNASLTHDVLSRAEPVYVEIEGWEEDLRQCTPATLPKPVKQLIEMVEKWTSLPVAGLGTGPERNDILWRASLRGTSD